MTALALPYSIHITKQANGNIITTSRDSANALIGACSIAVNASFDSQSSPHSLAGSTTSIDVGGTGNGTITVTGPIGWKSIDLNCQAGGTIISTSKDEAGVKISGPYVIGVNMSFDAARNKVAGGADIGASFGGGSVTVTGIALSSTSVSTPVANAGDVVGSFSVTTDPPNSPVTDPIVLSGVDAAKFAVTNGGVLPCDLAIGSVDVPAGTYAIAASVMSFTQAFSITVTTTGGLQPPAPVTMVNMGDTLATVQSKLNGVPVGGSLVFPSGYTITGALTGKAGITLWADGPVTVNGDMDFSSRTGWTVRGKEPGQGFVFNTTKINANGASGNWAVGNNVFNNQPTYANGDDGSTVRLNNASFGLVINNDFNTCQGTVLGKYGTDNITIDGNHFINCRQPLSIQEPSVANTNLGRNWVVRRNVFSGTTRAAMEFGPSSTGAEYFSGLVVDNNYFTNFNYTPNPDNYSALLAISLVGQASVSTTVTNNWIDMGSANLGHGAAIEFTGTGECTNNTCLRWHFEGFLYQNNWNFHGNKIYQVAVGAYANGPYTGTLVPSQVLTTAPPDPGWPARISW